MKRNIKELAETKFDLLIAGGGVCGAALSWLASLAGLSTAVVDQKDFAQATSANSQKIIHGGLRYLQDFDFRRTRQSLQECRRLMWLAPHLVRRLPCVMPIYGHGSKGREAVALGLKLYELIARGRSDQLPGLPEAMPGTSVLSVPEINRLIPGLSQKGLKGGAQWFDGICFNTERLVLSFIKSARQMGAVTANYVKVVRLDRSRHSFIVAQCVDTLDGEMFDVLAGRVANCTGPWIDDLPGPFEVKPNRSKTKFICGMNIITHRLLFEHTAAALRDTQGKSSRSYFVVPWRGKSIIGTQWFRYDGAPDACRVSESQCEELVARFNRVYPPANLALEDVSHVHTGLVPSVDGLGCDGGEIALLKHCRIIDHRDKGLERVVSVLPVKYTTAVAVAEQVLSRLFPYMTPRGRGIQPHLKGGEIEDFAAFQRAALKKWSSRIAGDGLLDLVSDYGTEFDKVLELAVQRTPLPSGRTELFYDIEKGKALFAVREEMAQRLSDVVLRRTGLSSAAYPSRERVNDISRIMAQELGWSEARRELELSDAMDSLQRILHRNARPAAFERSRSTTVAT